MAVRRDLVAALFAQGKRPYEIWRHLYRSDPGLSLDVIHLDIRMIRLRAGGSD